MVLYAKALGFGSNSEGVRDLGFGNNRSLLSLLQLDSTGPSLFDRLTASFKEQNVWLEVEGRMPIIAIAADWNPEPVPGSGLVCPSQQILFIPENENGVAELGPEAKDMMLVLALKGGESFEEIALHAEAAGAKAVVLINYDDEWSNNWEIGRDDPPTRQRPPAVPLILVEKKFSKVLCKHQNIRASIVKR